MIKGIGHGAYTVRDMDASLNFYCDILGFQKAFEIHKETGEPWIVYIKVVPGQFIELFYGGEEKHELTNKTIGFNHLCLEVDSVHVMAAHLKSKGINLWIEPQQGLDQNWQCWALDPDGNRIEFMELHPDSPHMNC